MGYGAILPIAGVLLTAIFAVLRRPSLRAKGILAGVLMISFVVGWQILAVVLQLAAALFVLLYVKAFRTDVFQDAPRRSR
jgi:hypothetical protein